MAALLGVVAILFVNGCSPKEDTTVLAKVGNREFRIADLDAEIARRTAARRPVPPLADLLAEMVEYETLLQGARKAGLEKDPEVERTYQNLLIGSFKEKELRPKLDGAVVSEAEITAAYDANPERYQVEARARFGVIFIAVDPRASAESRRIARERADEARSLALADAESGFAKTATRFSDEQSSRYKGGDIGWVKKGSGHSRVPRSVIDTGFELGVNDLSPVIEADDGYYLVKILGKELETLVPLEQARGSIAAQLIQAKRAAITTDFNQSIKDQVGAEIFDGRVSEIAASRGGAEIPEPAPPEL
jgi:peptidyl-prolyl cis-trans isomerase C